MKRPQRARWGAFALGLASAVTAALAVPALASTGAAQEGPTVKLAATAPDLTVQSFGGTVILDPGIYVVSLGSAFQLDVRRASYTAPITVAQVIHLPGGGTSAISWPSSVLDGFYGLKDFADLTVANTSGTVVASTQEEFCPNSTDPQRAVPGSAQTSPFPQACAFDPFAKSLVMGIARGWGVDSFVSLFQLAPGTYKVTATIAPQYVRLLHITPADATASVKVTVVKGNGSGGTRSPVHAPLKPASLSGVPDLAHPPAAALPDLIPLPAWQIDTSTQSGQDLLNFAATVWVSGNSQLDVEGFRVPGTLVMNAYQYFWQDGRVIGRASVGTMGYYPQPAYDNWHFQQFAKYQLLGANKKLVVSSHKLGFCIAPTDPVDLLAPHAMWQPPSIGLGNACGEQTALWAAEVLPVGWGDTYIQSLPGESFDITKVPNGTYYIEVVANPEHALYELNTGNDVSLREVSLGGTPGHRTVKVPAWNGIDPEN